MSTLDRRGPNDVRGTARRCSNLSVVAPLPLPAARHASFRAQPNKTSKNTNGAVPDLLGDQGRQHHIELRRNLGGSLHRFPQHAERDQTPRRNEQRVPRVEAILRYSLLARRGRSRCPNRERLKAHPKAWLKAMVWGLQSLAPPKQALMF